MSTATSAEQIRSALKAASSAGGGVVTFDGSITGLGKLQGIRGRPGSPVILRGLDPATSKIGSSGTLDVGNIRTEDSQHFRFENFTLLNATMNQARAFQAFRSNNLGWADLWTGPNVNFDQFHLVSTTDSLGERCHGDGTGAAGLVGGKGGHFIYVAEGCARITWQDCEAKKIMAAPLQCNAESGAVVDTTFRRIVLRDWLNGAAINLQAPQGVTIEDLDAETHANGAHDGVMLFDGGSGVTIARYRIVVPSGDELSPGVRVLEQGPPQPPQFDTAPPEQPPVEVPPAEDWEQMYRDLAAQMEQARQWYAAAPACLRG